MFVLYLLGFLLWRPWRQQCTGSLKRRHSAFVSVWSGPWPLEGSVAKCCELHRIGKLVSPDFGLLADDLDFFFLFFPAVCWCWGVFCTVHHRHHREQLFGAWLRSRENPGLFFLFDQFPTLRLSIFYFKPCLQLYMILKNTMNKPTFSWQKSFGWVKPILSQIRVDQKLFYCLDAELLLYLVSC